MGHEEAASAAARVSCALTRPQRRHVFVAFHCNSAAAMSIPCKERPACAYAAAAALMPLPVHHDVVTLGACMSITHVKRP